jgi:PilZ domain
MIRKLISKFNKSITKRVVSARHNYEVPIRVWIEPDRNTGRLQKPVEHLSVAGETKDMSKTGIAFIVPVIRLREYYLVGENRTLNAEIDLPNGKIQMQIVGRRYEQVGQHISEAKFLIGATILRLSEQQREAYEEFLEYGKKRKQAKGLALGVESDT